MMTGRRCSCRQPQNLVVFIRPGHVPCHGSNLSKGNLGQTGRPIHVQDNDDQVVSEAEAVRAEDARGVGFGGAREHLQSDGC